MYDTIRLYWTAQPATHLRQLANYAITLMQLGWHKSSLSITSQPSSGKRDIKRDRAYDSVCGRSHLQRIKTYAAKSQVKTPPTEGENNPASV